MAKDKLKKPKARNAQTPTSHDDGGESAYGNPKVTAANEVALTKTERLNPIGSGVLEEQRATHGYPGRAYPPTQKVTTATVQTNVAKQCLETQLDGNRKEMNRRVAEKGQP